MKTIKSIVFLGIIILLSSCATTVNFPVSTAVPAAEIVAKKKQDKHDNYVIELTAKNLADPGRLDPPKNNYSVWIVTENGETNNVGQLTNVNAKKANLTASTPFDVKEIFITAEDQGNLTYPRGIEISRTSFSK